MIPRVPPLPIAGEAIPRRRRCLAAPWSFVTDVGPEPCGLGPAGARGEQRNRSVVHEDCLGLQHMPADGVGQRLQQRRRLADPVRQGRSVEINAVAVIDLALPVERQMIGELADEHMGEQARPGTAPLDRAGRQRRLDEAFAPGAGQPRPDYAVHDEAAGDVFELLARHFLGPMRHGSPSSPIRRSLPPQSAQAPAAGLSSTSMRGTWSGIGRRFGWSFSSTSGRRSRAVIAAAAISLVSKASCNCSAVSEEAPKRCARWPPTGGAASRSGWPAPSPRPEAAP